jgi:uncharacterized protein YegL
MSPFAAEETSIMPGGGISRRPLHMIVMADCSGGMKGEKMQALNFAIADMLPRLAEWERDQEKADIMIRVLAFATTPFWHIADPTPVSAVRWKPLQAVPRGLTNLGPALQMVAEVLSPAHLERRALRPAIVVVTDGRPTDPDGQLEAGLASLDAIPAGRAALRLAVAIGRDANSLELNRFIGDPSIPVLVADHTDEIADRLVAASLAVSQVPDGGTAKQDALKQVLWGEVPQDTDTAGFTII